ncbi:MAG: tRNA (adenosine(37)-N6)-threonylcarbamoyltransferase complex dimerization subunit type 1 TsaB [Bryobacteraceae bacterium]|nr:tRNA (adenosine(37)-N6)-threonylcarbamoyltransferase complex dimerization subunit type 1 TsaB [Bryobacteraceae bacterium]
MTGRILAVDTTSENGSIALWEGGRLREEHAIHAPGGFGHILLSEIAALLKRHALWLPHIDCWAIAAGPGSFTGIRVGIAAVKGFAEAASRPVVPVSNLQAIAYFGEGDLRASLFDARRGEIYCGWYDANLRPVRPEGVMTVEAWRAMLPAGAVVVTPSPELASGLPRVMQSPLSLAGAVAAIAWPRFLAGETLHPALIDANYVRKSDAELHWRE